uniref:Uncharacterized protein n=1 Tax=Strongyloides venezuelensis TaxID=75913 RepID=A0A0K0EW50_STRVS
MSKNKYILLNEVKKSDSAKNAQKQIDQISSNESLYSNDKKTQIRQNKSNLIQTVLNELGNFKDSHMNLTSNGHLLESE